MTQEINEFLAASDVHGWAKDVMKTALEKDLVDAINHLECILIILDHRLTEMTLQEIQAHEITLKDGDGLSVADYLTSMSSPSDSDTPHRAD